MRIVIPSVQTPFIRGGATLMTRGLRAALIEAGHEVEIVTFPFKFSPADQVHQLMDFCQNSEFEWFTGYQIDRVIALQFPAYYVEHPHKTLWLMHQHRSAYELYHENHTDPETKSLVDYIHALDTEQLASIPHRYAMSANVARRLQHYNGCSAQAVYHPPPLQSRYHSEQALGFVFFPSRLETLKRQELLIRAAALLQTPLKVIIAGRGGQHTRYQKLIEQLKVQDKVRLLGEISNEELIEYFAYCTAVFFGPYDEDYGYVTLEAMLSQKPVVTCDDSGGPLEFVRDGETGLVVKPEPEHIAAALDELYRNPTYACQLGKQGFEAYQSLGISWHNVVSALLQK
jgi:glycosyltransferase involved in cell wall biosynthesis